MKIHWNIFLLCSISLCLSLCICCGSEDIDLSPIDQKIVLNWDGERYELTPEFSMSTPGFETVFYWQFDETGILGRFSLSESSSDRIVVGKTFLFEPRNTPYPALVACIKENNTCLQDNEYIVSSGEFTITSLDRDMGRISFDFDLVMEKQNDRESQLGIIGTATNIDF